MKAIYYAGIGSRDGVPEDVLRLMNQIGFILAHPKVHSFRKERYILRSGGARGCDSAFEKGVWDSISSYPKRPAAQAYAQIYKAPLHKSYVLPKKQPLAIPKGRITLAYTKASTVHPNWRNLSGAGRLLHQRNVLQILGNSKTTEFVICWTPDGADGRNYPTSKLTGGTATAINIATQYEGIKIFNLYQDEARAKIVDRLTSLQEETGVVYKERQLV